MMDDVTNNFYEDDEPVENIVAAFGPGPHPQTARPLPAGATLVGPVNSGADGYTIFPRAGALQVTRTPASSLTTV